MHKAEPIRRSLRLWFRTLLWTLLAIFVLLGFQAGCHSNTISPIMLPCQQQSKEILGLGLASSSRGFYYRNGKLYALLSRNINPATGAGVGLEYWEKSVGAGGWRQFRFPELEGRLFSMYDLVFTKNKNILYFIYNERTEEPRRGVLIDRFDGMVRQPLFEFDDEELVLNPVGVVDSRDQLHVFVPSRGNPSFIRWFTINPTTRETVRVDLSLPGRGTRLYGYGIYQEGDQVLLAAGEVGAVHLLEIDLRHRSAIVHTVDQFNHTEAARMFSIMVFPEMDIILLTYLRPASFSDRPRTGIVGEVVANLIDRATLQSRAIAPLGEFSAQNAATHYTHAVKIAPDMFAVIYTTVREIHLWSKTGVHGNYNLSYLCWYRLSGSSSNPTLQKVDQQVLPAYWGSSLAWIDTERTLVLTCNDTDTMATKRVFYWRCGR